MDAAHQAVAGSRHEQHARDHPASVINPECWAEAERSGQILKSRVLQNCKRVPGKDFVDHDDDQRDHQKRDQLSRAIVENVNGGGDRTLPRRHVLGRFTGGFCTPLGNKLVGDFQILWIRLFCSHGCPSHLETPLAGTSFLKRVAGSSLGPCRK